MIIFRNKKKPGFTLIEVLLALAIIALVLTPVFLTQINVYKGSTKAARMLARIFAAKTMLITSEFDLAPDARELRVEKKIDNPRTTLIYELKKVSEASALKKFKNLLNESVTMQWVDANGKKRQEKLVTFLYKPGKAA